MEMEMVLMLGMMLMMISMMPVTMMMTMVTISPAESARWRWLFSSVGFRSVVAEERRNDSPFRVSTPGGLYRRKGAPRGATRHPGGCLARPGGGPRQAPFWLPGGSPHLLLR